MASLFELPPHPSSRHLKFHGGVSALLYPAWLQLSALGAFLGCPMTWEALKATATLDDGNDHPKSDLDGDSPGVAPM